MKPICVPCERFMRCKKTGFYFVEGMPHSHPTEEWDGKQGKGSVGWSPYKIWVGDLYECPTCGAQTVAGVNRSPVSEHFEPDFAHYRATLVGGMPIQLMVKDC